MKKSVCRLGLYGIAAFLVTILSSVYPAMARECINCHTDVLKQLRGNSHHIQGTGISGKHCYSCHWEATEEGKVNVRYHRNTVAKTTPKVANSAVHLVVWKDGERPTVYKLGKTAVTFLTSAIGTASEREEVAKVTLHCLGCHSDSNNNTHPFFGDSSVPIKYAWDGQSVASRYSQKGVTTWGKYSTATTNKKQRVAKSFSAHGNATSNLGGWNQSNGYDGDMPITRGGTGARNVECYDCHNSHGSTVSGITSSYRSFAGNFNGAILKQTRSGKGGYRITYKPSANLDAKSKNPYNVGAGLCFDCHETAKAGGTPWGYNSTFGAEQPIMSYKDTLRFGPGSKGSTFRFANRQSRLDIASSHLKAGKFLNYTAHGQINGLCTSCHDPHGVSQTLGDKMPYALPLLKGTWLTSPYREDGPPSSLTGKNDSAKREGNTGVGEKGDFNAVNREANANFGKGDSAAPRQGDFNAVNREANANFGKGDSAAPRQGDFNAVNREANANFGKGDSAAPRQGDFNAVNREANANFGKGDSAAPRQGDFNAVNREANANFGKGDSAAPRQGDFNAVNREANANFGKGDSAAPRQGDFNAVNREANANFGKGDSAAPRQGDFNAVNREANANFGKGDSAAPRQGDFNAVNREANANYGKGDSVAPRENDANTANREANANFGKGGSGSPREPMQGMKYNVDRNTFGDNNRIAENDDTFGGICLKCHPRDKLSGGSKSGLIHRTVKGWGSNKEHSFPCSKCHQVHDSGLPRLMQTNCFERGPSGLRENSGVPWLPYKKIDAKSQNQNSQNPAAKSGASSKNKIVGCHVRQFSKATTASHKEEEGNQWEKVTTW